MKKAIFQALAVATLAILPATAQAVPIVGSIDLAGRVRITPDTIDWLTGNIPGPPTGTAVVFNSSGYFDDLIPFQSIATELDLSGVPVGVSGLLLPGFETFEDMPGVNFILDQILSCGQTSIDPATQCVLGEDSAFRFDVDASGTVVVMNFLGFVIDTLNPDPTEVSIFGAKFSATFLNQTPAQILAAFGPNGPGYVETPYSAQKITVDIPIQEVPEPATLLTFGAGTALLAAHRRRRAKKAAK